MCGIAGAVGRLAPFAASARPSRDAGVVDCVERISAALRHRGPDSSGFWATTDRDVIFAHRRLAIIDLSAGGAQPMVDGDSGCAITFNGEIYNFMDLRRELEALGVSFRSSSDTEVLLKAYRQWGLDAMPRLRGIFAMAIWDPRSRSVHLVRDQMGIKPLYWTIARNGDSGQEILLFASEVRALLASGLVPRRLDPTAVASYLFQGFVVGPATIVEGVHLLPAASTLTIAPGAGANEANTRVLRRYWTMPSSATRRTTAAELREELARTVRMQLVSDVPLGVFLSGGIDSSAVAALASEVAPGAVHTFTIGFDEAALDESRYAAMVAKAIRSHHTNVTLREEDFLAQLPDAFSAIDQPTFDAINTYFVSRAARQAGMTVALAGTGGDELFGGYPSFVDLPKALRAGSWLPAATGMGRRALDGVIGGAAQFANRVFWNVLGQAPPQTRWGKIADVARAAHDLLGLYQVSYALFTQETQARLASTAVRNAQRAQDFGLPSEVAREWRARIEGSELLHAISVLELSSFVGERLLRDTDAASMAVALEVRVPLLDHVLYEAVAGIDPAQRFSPPRKKQLLRDVALSRLDPAIFDRPKSGFVLPIDAWARRMVQPRMEQILSDAALVGRVGLRPDAVRTLWRSFIAGRPGLYWSRVWSIYVLLSWCQTHEMALPS
jgi:asparagine synthase (glutamine-hydrolysing)